MGAIMAHTIGLYLAGAAVSAYALFLVGTSWPGL